MNHKLETFLNLSAHELSARVQAAGPHVCTLSLRGARRAHYTAARSPVLPPLVGFAAVAPYSLIFEHGIDTLLVPLRGMDPNHHGMTPADFAALASRPDFLELYDRLQVRVRFYGEYRAWLSATPHAYLIDMFDTLAERTRRHNHHRLFFGLYPTDSAETLAGLSLRHYQKHGHLPDRAALITLYYGEYVEPVSLVLAIDPYNAADTPLLATGSEEFYIIHGGLGGLTQRRLRHILYDHLATGAQKTFEPLALDANEVDWLHDFSTAPGDLWRASYDNESAWPGD